MTGFPKAICIAISVLLTAFLIYGLATGQVVADQLHVWERVWGVYVWADVYSGFILFSLLIYTFERRLDLTLALLLLACFSGNVVNALWLLWRGPILFRRISGQRA